MWRAWLIHMWDTRHVSIICNMSHAWLMHMWLGHVIRFIYEFDIQSDLSCLNLKGYVTHENETSHMNVTWHATKWQVCIKVGLGISPIKAVVTKSQWIQFARYSIEFVVVEMKKIAGNSVDVILTWQTLNQQQVLWQGCGKQTPSASIDFFHTYLSYARRIQSTRDSI